MKLRYALIGFVLLGLIAVVIWFSLGSRFSSKPVEVQPEASNPKKHAEHEEGDHPHPSSEKEEHKEHGEEEEHDSHKEGEEHEHGNEEKHKEGEEEESVGGVGKNNAVTAANEDTGIQLSEKAIEVIQLKMEPYEGKSIPKNALVYYQDQVGVYRFREAWFKLIPVEVKNREGEKISVYSADLKSEDQIVTQGIGLLRAAELDAFSSEAGHSH